MTLISELLAKFPGEIVDDAIRIHEHLAPGIILGFKMAMLALRDLKPAPEDVIILTSETTRCIPDGLQALGRYLLLKGGYHVYSRAYDVGKLAIQVSINHDDAFRVVISEDYLKKNKDLHAWVYLPKEEQLPLEDIKKMMWGLDIDEAFEKKNFKKKVKPEFKKKLVIKCPSCGEATSRLSMIEKDGVPTCKTCVFFEK
ncbi:MAG: FmdE family protein [Promethearchaeota archaeon]